MPRHMKYRHRVARRRNRRIHGGSFRSWMNKTLNWIKGPGFKGARQIFNDPATRKLITTYNPGARAVFNKGDEAQNYISHMANVLGSGRRRRTVSLRKKKRRGGSLYGFGLGP